MALRILHDNQITRIDSDSTTSNGHERLLNKSSWNNWVDQDKTSHLFTCDLGGNGNIGSNADRPIDAVSIVFPWDRNLVDAQVQFMLYQSDVLIETTIQKPLLKSAKHSDLPPMTLDAKGYPLRIHQDQFVHIHYLPVKTLINKIGIQLNYSAQINPKLVQVTATEYASTEYDAGRGYTPISSDYSYRSTLRNGTTFTKRKPTKKGFSLFWPAITSSERFLLEQLRHNAGTTEPVIFDVYPGRNEYKDSVHKRWATFTTDLAIDAHEAAAGEYFTASANIMEH